MDAAYGGMNSGTTSYTAGAVASPTFNTATAPQAHMSNATFNPPDGTVLPDNVAGPSTKRRQSEASESSKKKRTTGPLSMGDVEGDQGHNTTKEKKKKASRACIHCQKAHLTCDDTRPCQRCTKRGIADTCVEGQRKKAKYLLEDSEIPTRRRPTDRSKGSEAPDVVTYQNGLLPNSTSASTIRGNIQTTEPVQQLPQDDPFFNLATNSVYSFGSTAANLEYSILSAMLGNPSPHDDLNMRMPSPPPSTTVSNFPVQNPGWPGVPMETGGMGFMNNGQPAGSASISGPMEVNGVASSNMSMGYDQNPARKMSSDPNANVNANGSSAAGGLKSTINTLAPPTPPTSDHSPSLAAISPAFQTSQHQDWMQAGPSTEVAPKSALPTSQQMVPQAQRTTDVYKSVTEPYDYVDGYHYLMQYLQGRFDKMDILRIVRALAVYRPSLIALQMPLSREDEIFVEQAFQRTMVELEKLISYSGTPTAVWRRTGEICLVGVEFAMLTGWSRAELVEKQKFIYEVFEHQSVVEYWEKFASHAFESSSQTVYSHCVLLKPTGEPIPCAFCFSIRRDVFDLPNVVIGQWLPLL
ncbi:Transcriptional regulator of nonfermentable carbon utilization [Tulasnella sp. JGI-2019a]|nr:Transcriptional regulator of nonfermentable carbon utilization [Tulasnella sp. JGI-2019a]